MSYSFVNKPAVTFDIEDVVDYYVSINPELATAFLDRVEETKKYITLAKTLAKIYMKIQTMIGENKNIKKQQQTMITITI